MGRRVIHDRCDEDKIPTAKPTTHSGDKTFQMEMKSALGGVVMSLEVGVKMSLEVRCRCESGVLC